MKQKIVPDTSVIISGTNGGTNDTCSLPIPINGVCGTANNICTNGTSVDVVDTSTNYLWNCAGANGGTNDTCSLPIPINGLCGAANNICTTGTLNDITDTSTNYLWNCTGTNEIG